MKTKRRIKSVYLKLQKANQTAETILATSILAWILEESKESFDKIIPGIEEPKPKMSANSFNYNEEQYIWCMEDPLNDTHIYIIDSVPSHTPRSWWKKYSVDDIEGELTYGEDYFQLSEYFDNSDTINWTDVIPFQTEFKNYFRTISSAEKFLSHYLTIDKEDYFEVNAAERRAFQDRTKCNANVMKSRLEQELNAKFIYSFKKNGELIWAMQHKGKID